MKAFVSFLFKSVAFLVSSLPMKLQLFLGDCIGWLWFDVLRIRRKIIFSNLKVAFPDKSKRDKIRIGRASCCNMGRGLIEFTRIPFLKPDEKSIDLFEFRGLEYLDSAKSQGKGVCLLSLHLGNGDFGVAGLAIKGVRLHLISKQFKIQWINDLWFGLRESLGTKFIPPRNSSYGVLKALRAKEPVVFVQDQFMGPPIGLKTTFFGKETGTAMGLAIMVQRTGAPVLPIYTYREDSGKTVVIFEKPLEFDKIEDKEEKILHITQKCNDKLEDLVRKKPEQWMWVHRRWKRFKD